MTWPLAKLAFAELSPRDRIELLNGLLAQLSADQVIVAINDTESLGLVAEARLIGLERSDDPSLLEHATNDGLVVFGHRFPPNRIT